ncbi:hypothetical protein AB0I81_50635 [Nonomuraea sp. NPDC050404]|uniref:hypothetical protein n=1 Tax=Nonomuraea sp. NPDC050404 TaxID=3155783 RepID=UPI0033DAC4FB
MKIRFLGSTSDGGGCPAVYDTDRRTLIVQGKIVTDPDALGSLVNLDSDETVVEIPIELMKFFPEHP